MFLYLRSIPVKTGSEERGARSEVEKEKAEEVEKEGVVGEVSGEGLEGGSSWRERVEVFLAENQRYLIGGSR